MKTWQAYLLAALFIAVLWFFTPEEITSTITNLVVILSAVWVYNNAKKIEIEKYKSNLSMSPLAIAAWTLFLWPIFFPAYLGFNWRIKHGKQPLKTAQNKVSQANN